MHCHETTRRTAFGKVLGCEPLACFDPLQITRANFQSALPPWLENTAIQTCHACSVWVCLSRHICSAAAVEVIQHLQDQGHIQRSGAGIQVADVQGRTRCSGIGKQLMEVGEIFEYAATVNEKWCG